jgi:hypothetical protein
MRFGRIHEGGGPSTSPGRPFPNPGAASCVVPTPMPPNTIRGLGWRRILLIREGAAGLGSVIAEDHLR